MTRFLIALAALLVLFAVGCAPSATRKPAKGNTDAPYDFEREGKVPELSETDVDEEADVVETPVTDEALDVEEAEAPPDTAQAEAAPSVPMVDGFRVQVFASASRDVADGARRSAAARLGVPAYVEIVDGLYKVTVGDCRTREEAERLLARCREGHYKDAWIVETKVVAPAGG